MRNLSTFCGRVLDKKLAATEASSTRLRWKQLPKMQLFKNALQNEVIWKHRFPVLKSTDENGNFRNDEVTVTYLAPDESAFLPPSPF